MIMNLKGRPVSPELRLGRVTLDQMPVKDKKLAATGLARISVRKLVRGGLRDGGSYKIIL